MMAHPMSIPRLLVTGGRTGSGVVGSEVAGSQVAGSEVVGRAESEPSLEAEVFSELIGKDTFM